MGSTINAIIRIWELIGILTIPYAVMFVTKVKKLHKPDAPLTKEEKMQVIITEIISPYFAGAVYYYGWKNTLPMKAKEANKYSWMCMGIIAVIVLIILAPTITAQIDALNQINHVTHNYDPTKGTNWTQ